jgi:hypothetical protein
MVCGLIGILGAVVVRVFLAAVGVDAIVALRLLTYTSIGVLLAFTSWQLWFGP